MPFLPPNQQRQSTEGKHVYMKFVLCELQGTKVLIQLAQCWFRVLAISNAKI